jgi:hypothetical protein
MILEVKNKTLNVPEKHGFLFRMFAVAIKNKNGLNMNWK